MNVEVLNTRLRLLLGDQAMQIVGLQVQLEAAQAAAAEAEARAAELAAELSNRP